MKLINSFELLKALKKEYKADKQGPLWWPNSGSFEVVVGTILTQQTRWDRVELSLKTLKAKQLLNLISLSKIDTQELETLIIPSGFYRKKAKVLKLLSQNIIKDFENFENFALHVTRAWLLSQKGIGNESADSILCYACKKEYMVVDSYTNRLLRHYGYEFETYEEIQEWLTNGLYENLKLLKNLYQEQIKMYEIFARFHGKIVMYCKENMRGKSLTKELLELSSS